MEYQAARFLMCLFGPAELQMEEEELLELSVVQEQVLSKILGKPDYNGLTEFQVRFALLQCQECSDLTVLFKGPGLPPRQAEVR